MSSSSSVEEIESDVPQAKLHEADSEDDGASSVPQFLLHQIHSSKRCSVQTHFLSSSWCFLNSVIGFGRKKVGFTAFFRPKRTRLALRPSLLKPSFLTGFRNTSASVLHFTKFIAQNVFIVLFRADTCSSDDGVHHHREDHLQERLRKVHTIITLSTREGIGKGVN